MSADDEDLGALLARQGAQLDALSGKLDALSRQLDAVLVMLGELLIRARAADDDLSDEDEL